MIITKQEVIHSSGQLKAPETLGGVAKPNEHTLQVSMMHACVCLCVCVTMETVRGQGCVCDVNTYFHVWFFSLSTLDLKNCEV